MFSDTRGKAKVRLLAVHTTEGILKAADLRTFFNKPTASGSSHASADADGVLLSGAGDGFVDYDRAAWTLRSGNSISDNIELCGFAKWKRPDWLARPALLNACARWLAARSVARGIPLVKLSPQEVAAGKPGVIGHADWTTGMSDGTHWDPGPDFPWDVVLGQARVYAGNPSEEDDMAGEAQEILEQVVEVRRLCAVLLGAQPAAGPAETGTLQQIAATTENSAEARRMLAVLLGVRPPAGSERLPGVSGALAALTQNDLDAIARAVNDELARRQSS